MKTIYFDNAATTPVEKEVALVAEKFMTEYYGNASTLYKLGRNAREAVEQARERIAKFLQVTPEEIIFTSGGTESNNLALQGLAQAQPEKKHIITSVIEHPSVIEVCKMRERRGYKVDYITVDKEGIVDVEEIKKKINENTLVVTIMHVNNEIGTIQPIEEIAQICRARNVPFHTDAVQSFGKMNIDASKFDLLSASGHKINAPKGAGFLYIKKGVKIHPLMHGGGQERGIRSGTENVAGIAALGKAVEIAEKRLKKKKDEKIRKLRDKMIAELLKIPGTRLNGSKDKRLWNNVSISFMDAEGEAIVLMLDEKGICCSTGSACSSHSLKSSSVLKAIGLDDSESHGSIRLTLGWQSTEREVNYAVKEIKKVVERLRGIYGK